MIERSGERKALVVGHSMGGLVARAALAMTKNGGSRNSFQLGAERRSFAPLQALRAVYPTVRKIAALDRITPRSACARGVSHAPRHLSDAAVTRRSGQADLLDPRRLAPDPKLLAHVRTQGCARASNDERCSVIVGVGQGRSCLPRGSDTRSIPARAEGDGTVPLSRARWGEAATWFVQKITAP